jgi:hypothetical protein
MAFSARYLQKCFHALVSQQRNAGFYARGTLELVMFHSIDFLHSVDWGARFTRQQFNCRFSRTGYAGPK